MTNAPTTSTIGRTGAQLPVPYLPPEPPSAAHEDKLYLVTRADLSAGYQITQTVHAAADFLIAHPDIARTWHDISNSVIVLTAADCAALHTLRDKARDRGITTTEFREPDLGDELTAIAFAPSAATRKLLSNLPLAGRKLADQDTLIAREKRMRELSYAMMDCEQTPGQDLLAHGRSVREHYVALLDHIACRQDLHSAPNWRIPAWVDDYAEQLLAHTLPAHIMDRYQTLHDAGKFRVREVGEDGRVRFPGHAEASRQEYLDVAGNTADPVVADLIAGDMDVHLLNADNLPAFAAKPTAVAHLLTGLAEVTSNAAMFGGTDSTSFKIKFKHLDRRGRQVCRLLFGEPTVKVEDAAERR